MRRLSAPSRRLFRRRYRTGDCLRAKDIWRKPVQEAEGKWPDLKAGHADIELHLIGPLQTNKTRNAVALFDVIQTLDRPKLAQSLAREMEKADRRLPCYLQINTGEEPQKAGISPREADAFVKACRDDYQLDIAGLMCIPPAKRRSITAFRVVGGYCRPKRPDRLKHGHERGLPFGN